MTRTRFLAFAIGLSAVLAACSSGRAPRPPRPLRVGRPVDRLVRRPELGGTGG